MMKPIKKPSEKQINEYKKLESIVNESFKHISQVANPPEDKKTPVTKIGTVELPH